MTGPAWAAAAAVVDPELPAVTIEELGILRDVTVAPDGRRVTVTVTPTYAGCPAMDAIGGDIRRALGAAGYHDIEIAVALAPAWTTDWITVEGRGKLAAAGIAPPGPATPVALRLTVRCPHCGSPETGPLSRFGSTACRALWRCRACAEPFDAIKAI